MCGIVGVFSDSNNATELLFDSIFQLQHRGQETAGMSVTDGKVITTVVGPGYVSEVFSDSMLKTMVGFAGIAHTRYSTAGDKTRGGNAQPITAKSRHGEVAIAHNGNLTNDLSLRAKLVSKGAIFKHTSDTEVILHLHARSISNDRIQGLIEAVTQIEGAFSLVVLFEDMLVAIRDPNDFRPLSLGKIGKTWIVASETVALDVHKADFVRDIEPGEIVIINKDGVNSHLVLKSGLKQKCIFEHVYFSRPDSEVFGQSVSEVREEIGRILAVEQPANADIVVPVPDSGVFAAFGYAQISGLPFKMGLIRNHYIGRTFILPHQAKRTKGVRDKLNPNKAVLKNKRVVLIDDSIVRGTTSKKIVSMVRRAGATEIHVRIAGPPTIASCLYGIDTPRSGDLIAFNKTIEQIRIEIGADSLAYLSLDGLKRAVNDQNDRCTSCYTGHYPLQDERQFVQVERRRNP